MSTSQRAVTLCSCWVVKDCMLGSVACLQVELSVVISERFRKYIWYLKPLYKCPGLLYFFALPWSKSHPQVSFPADHWWMLWLVLEHTQSKLLQKPSLLHVVLVFKLDTSNLTNPCTRHQIKVIPKGAWFGAGPFLNLTFNLTFLKIFILNYIFKKL